MHTIAHEERERGEGGTDTVRESSLKVDSGRKIPCRTRRIEPESAARRSDALPTELHPHPSAWCLL